MAWLVGHREPKGAETEMPRLSPPRQSSTLPIVLKTPFQHTATSFLGVSVHQPSDDRRSWAVLRGRSFCTSTPNTRCSSFSTLLVVLRPSTIKLLAVRLDGRRTAHSARRPASTSIASGRNDQRLPLNGTTFCFCAPRPSMPSVMTSPGLSHVWGFIPMPTPGGVPVVITSPGKSVM